jgi:hypothetical protein
MLPWQWRDRARLHGLQGIPEVRPAYVCQGECANSQVWEEQTEMLQRPQV